MKSVKVNRVKERKVERILNKRKIREVVKHLVWWKEFIVEYNIWEKEKDLEIRRQEKLDLTEKRDFRRGKSSKKYIVKMLYR